jgi:hypothetical protein
MYEGMTIHYTIFAPEQGSPVVLVKFTDGQWSGEKDDCRAKFATWRDLLVSSHPLVIEAFNSQFPLFVS